MLLSWHFLSTCLMFIWLYPSNALCPTNCTCRQTDKGKRKVSCTIGGMLDPIPIADMDPGMEILEITAPPTNKNQLSIAPIFQQFKHLEEVHITDSNIHQITMHAFWGVPSLRQLNLTFNNIATVLDHNFRGLLNLVELNLDDNRIDRLQNGAFKHLTELRILTLRNNLLQELVPRIFLKLAKLHVLKLSGNKLDELNPEVFKDIPDLRVLECRGCGLRRINTQIYHLLPYLSQLDLGNNEMQFIASDEFRDLHRLLSLKLDGNQLPVILEKTFINQQKLKYLCLARNRLAKITNTAFLNLSSLTELDIGYNKLSKIEGIALQHIADTLQRLVISGNSFPVSVIKIVLQTLYRVTSVDLAQMKLLTLPEKLLPDRIKKLNISRNNLTEITIETLPKQIQELDLTNNQLKGLNERAILKFELMKIVHIHPNPWTCTLCHISTILLRANRTNLFKELTCASPKFLKGKLLTLLRIEDVPMCNNQIHNDDLNNSEDDSDNKMGLIIGLICIVMFTIASIIFVVCSCMRRHARNLARQAKRNAELHENNLASATAIFSKGEISFKFPLDLTERKMSVSTIDEIKRDTTTAQHPNLPNGTGI